MIPCRGTGEEIGIQQVFEFAFDARFRAPLALVGVLPQTARVTVTADEFDARFGPWRLRTPRWNILDAEVSGPYRWYRAVGTRLSFADHGATFGSTARAGLCVSFVEPVSALLPGGLLRHPGLTVTVADPAGLRDAL
ncbi:MAG TPA: hypothetical protein VE081_06100, partial [Sporichthyaceae bacterium]|nr:hypothetical protein [Sporichthyaceae bacterium]